jgi:hypothetical protein
MRNFYPANVSLPLIMVHDRRVEVAVTRPSAWNHIVPTRAYSKDFYQMPKFGSYCPLKWKRRSTVVVRFLSRPVVPTNRYGRASFSLGWSVEKLMIVVRLSYAITVCWRNRTRTRGEHRLCNVITIFFFGGLHTYDAGYARATSPPHGRA